MVKIIYPDKKPSIKMESEVETVFCIIRKRWVQLTPEEWVRQNFLLYLTESLGYPAALIAVEKQLTLGELTKRFDAVVYDKQSNPFMIIECKEMNVPLSEKVLQQVLRYNMQLQATYLVVTNGSYCEVYKRSGNELEHIGFFPDYGK
mgnify:CR=1 FL=1